MKYFSKLQLPTDASEIDLEEHIFQHLAAAAAIRSGHHVFRRGGQSQRVRLSSQGQPPFLTFSGPTAPHDAVTSLNTVGGGSRSITESSQRASTMNPNTSVAQVSPPQVDEVSVHRVESNVASANPQRVLSETR